jgi:hypothetical protein
MTPGYKNAAIINALRRAAAHERFENFARGVGKLRVAQERRGRIRAHAAGVQAEVAVERALVILRRGENLRRLAVAQRVQRNLDAFEKFLDDHARARRAEGLADHDFVHGLFRFGLVGANQNAFAEREAVGFHHAFAAERAQRLRRPAIEKFRPRRRDAVFLHELLGENLRRLELRGFLVRPQMRRPFFWNKSTMPSASGLSGPTTVRSIFFSCANASSFGQILRADVHAFDGRGFWRAFLRDAGVAGRAPHCVTCGDCASFHTSACSRPPEPMTRSFMSISMGSRLGTSSRPSWSSRACRKAALFWCCQSGSAHLRSILKCFERPV